MREMANLLEHHACAAAQQGDVIESMQCVHDLIFLSRAAGSIRMLVGELVADGIDRIAGNTASDCGWLLPSRRLSEAERDAATSGATGFDE